MYKSTVTGQLAHKPTHGLDISRTGQDDYVDIKRVTVSYWSVSWSTTSASCPVRELAYLRVVQLPNQRGSHKID